MVRTMIMARSNEERFVMGALMFDAAREMILASFPPDLPESEKRRRLFQRVYGDSPLAKDATAMDLIVGSPKMECFTI